MVSLFYKVPEPTRGTNSNHRMVTVSWSISVQWQLNMLPVIGKCRLKSNCRHADLCFKLLFLCNFLGFSFLSFAPRQLVHKLQFLQQLLSSLQRVFLLPSDLVHLPLDLFLSPAHHLINTRQQIMKTETEQFSQTICKIITCTSKQFRSGINWKIIWSSDVSINSYMQNVHVLFCICCWLLLICYLSCWCQSPYHLSVLLMFVLFTVVALLYFVYCPVTNKYDNDDTNILAANGTDMMTLTITLKMLMFDLLHELFTGQPLFLPLRLPLLPDTSGFISATHEFHIQVSLYTPVINLSITYLSSSHARISNRFVFDWFNCRKLITVSLDFLHFPLKLWHSVTFPGFPREWSLCDFRLFIP